MVSVQKVSVLEEVDCTVHSLLTDSKTDTSIKWTPRFDPDLSLLLLVDSQLVKRTSL